MGTCSLCGNPLNKTQYVLVSHALYKSCPNCSQKCDEHIHYFCPEAFGTTTARRSLNDPLGMQSQCSRCRSGKEGPHEDALRCSKLSHNGGYVINEIRLLPMSKDVFSSEPLALDFLTNILPRRGCTYYYLSRKIDCSAGTLMLFQYNANLWGYAVCISVQEFDRPLVEDGTTYKGYYQFAPETLTTFDTPITADELSKIDVTFKGFGQAARRMTPSLLPAIIKLLRQKGIKAVEIIARAPKLPEELDEEELVVKEGAKKQITINAYERNPKAREDCIRYYRRKNDGKIFCEICGFDFGKVYGDEFADMINVHHVVEISSIGKEYEIHANTDLIPVCPNCHMVAHARKPAYTPKEIKSMIGKKNA